MELKATYKELSSYILARFGQSVNLACAEDGDLKISYIKRILFKDVSISIYLHFEKVTGDTVTLRYKGALGLDMIISGALSFFTAHFPELATGIHPEDSRRIRVCLSEIEKAKSVVENVNLRALTPCADEIKIEFDLKA